MLGIFPSQKIALMQLLTLRKLFTSLQDFNVGIFIDIFLILNEVRTVFQN